VSHVGIQVGSTAIVQHELERVKDAGLRAIEEVGVNCCHANQDKFWVVDPDDVSWEVYHLNYDIEAVSTGAACAHELADSSAIENPSITLTPADDVHLPEERIV